jgi:hypothetical protein
MSITAMTHSYLPYTDLQKRNLHCIILDGEGGAVSDDGRNVHVAALLRSFCIHGTTIHGTNSSSRLYEVQQMGPI